MKGKKVIAGILLAGILAVTLAGCKNTDNTKDETGVVNTTMALKDININLQSWRKSLNDSKNHTVIDLIGG